MSREGCVYLRRKDPDTGPPGRWEGHWEKPVDPSREYRPGWKAAIEQGLVEVGEWPTVEEAIAWGRARCDRVLVYVKHDIGWIYSAGEIHETEGPSPGNSGRWPSGHRRRMCGRA